MNITVTLHKESDGKFRSKAARFAIQLNGDWHETMIGNLILNLHELAVLAYNEMQVIDLPLENCKYGGGAIISLSVKASFDW